jgi:capsular polysaccharide biosynthesis protein
VIVAPHGAALTNIVFTPPGALVVELFGDNYVNGCFWAIANLCGHTHAFLSVPTTNINFAVPLERLKLLAARLGHFSLANERGSGRRVRPTAQTSIKP